MISSLSLWSSTDILQRVTEAWNGLWGAPRFACKMQAVNHSSRWAWETTPHHRPHRPPPSPLRAAAELKGREHISATGRILNTTGRKQRLEQVYPMKTLFSRLLNCLSTPFSGEGTREFTRLVASLNFHFNSQYFLSAFVVPCTVGDAGEKKNEQNS